MSATTVIGQPNFTSNSSTPVTGSSLNSPYGVFTDGRRLIVADNSNNRVLIWNTFPPENGASADIVLGQPNLTSNTANNGGVSARTLNRPQSLYFDGTKLYVADRNNNRVLIWNSFPTVTFQPADVVVGQPDFTTVSSGTSRQKFSQPIGVFAKDNKLFVGESNNNRAVIFNTIPTTNNAAADVVVGQPDFTTSTSVVNNTNTGSLRGLLVYNNKLILAGSGYSRVMIWNTVPTTNGQPADVVLGQPNFTTSTPDTGGISCATMDTPDSVSVFGNGRLAVGENNRVLIFNQIPTRNFETADLVIGQPNCTTRTANTGGIGPNTISNSGRPGFSTDDRYFLVADNSNHRVLIFRNVVDMPTLNLSQIEPKGHVLLISGTVQTALPNVVHSVEIALNGSGFQKATPDDGGWNSASETFSAQLDRTAAPSKDELGHEVAGYTLQARAKNNNADQIDHVFRFSPFGLNSPADGETLELTYPTFDFSVNKQRLILRDNLSHFAVQTRNRSTGGDWTTHIDQIPVDFASRKNDSENLQHSLWQSLDVLEGQYETDKFMASYADQGSRVIVRSKSPLLGGTYEWRVVAVDKSGHSQETGARTLLVNGSTGSVTPGFPLAVLNISGIGNPNISSYSLLSMKKSYSTTSTAPTFYGIAWSGAKVTLQLTEQNCTANCTQVFTMDANFMSRWGINLPSGSLKRGKIYQTRLFVQKENLYTELPSFSLTIK